MGICISCESTSIATAKVILQNGRLQEYSYPVKASFVISNDPNFFICNSEDMDFNGVISAIKDDEELQPGELYFALPRAKLLRPLQVEEMAALAVKANAALLKSQGKENCGCRKKVGFFGGERDYYKERNSSKVVDLGFLTEQRNRRNGNGGRGKMYVANLTVIPE